MPIICFPDEIRPPRVVDCVLCGHRIILAKAVLGPRDVDGKQTFACSTHSKDHRLLILGWADFVIMQKLELLQRGIMPNDGEAVVCTVFM